MDAYGDSPCKELAKNQEKLRWELKINAALASLSKAIISLDVTSGEIYQMVLDYARDLTESKHGVVGSIDPLNGAYMSRTLTKMAKEGCSISDELYIPPEQPHGRFGTLWGHAMDIRTAFFTNNPAFHPTSRGVPDGHVPLENYLAVPVIFKGELLGQIAVANSRRDYTEADLEAVERLGELYAVALHSRQREKALWESEERFRLLCEKAPVMIDLVDKDGRMLLWNNEAEKRLGFSTEEIQTSQNPLAVFYPDPGEMEKVLQDVMEGTGEFNEYRPVAKDGTRRIQRWADIRLPSGGSLGIGYDITEQKQTEEALRESEEQFRQMFAKQQVAMYLVEPDTLNIIDANEAAQRFYGYNREEFKKLRATDLNMLSEDEAKKLIYDISQNQGRSREIKHRLKNGNIREMEAWFTQINLQTRQFFFVIVHDISERKQMEEELRQWEQQTRQELDLAAQVQRETLPKPFTGEKVRINTVFLPYHAVSGDFFNYKWFEEQQKLCGYIIDVSGHGVSTALQTAMVKILLDNILLRGREIDEIDFQLINKRMMQYLSEEAFAGVQYFEFDFQSAILKVVSAGIQFFLAAKPDECALVPVFSSYLGMFDKAGVQTLTMPFKAGETYCMMSDGVSDLIESHGICKQAGLPEYMDCLWNLALSPDRRDDFSAICIEIL